MPQLRQNIITGEWVVIAPERAKRPSDFIARKDTVRPDTEEDDVFAVGGEAWKGRYIDYDTERTYTMPNKYPAFIENPIHASPRSHRVEDDFYRIRPSVGGHDVVVVNDPDTGPAKFDEKTWFELLSVFKKRYEYYENISKSIYTMPIYNHKPEAAASIWHPHAQVFASTVVPNLVVKEMHNCEKYFEHNGSSAFIDMANHEKKEGTRVIAENMSFIAFTFFAARFPFEIWIVPKRHSDKFEDISEPEMRSFAKICHDVFHKLDDVLDDPPLNFFIHSSPNISHHTTYYSWHMEIGPRLTNYGGFELGAGMVIDIVSPEKAAMYLKGAEID